MLEFTLESVGDLYLGAVCEGPPGHVHGGVAAPVLDHLLGEAAADAQGVTVEAEGLFIQPRWFRERAE